MAKFNGRTCIIYAKYLEGGGEGKEIQTVERETIIERDADKNQVSRKIGTHKVHSETNSKEVLVKSLESKIDVVDGIFKKEVLMEAIYNLYVDLISTSGVTPNERVSQLIASSISISEIKALESGWSNGTSNAFYTACKAGIDSKAIITQPRVDMYRAIDTLQKSKSVINTEFFGDLKRGSGSPTCAADRAKTILHRDTFLLKETSVDSGKYVNKAPGYTDAQWRTAVMAMAITECG